VCGHDSVSLYPFIDADFQPTCTSFNGYEPATVDPQLLDLPQTPHEAAASQCGSTPSCAGTGNETTFSSPESCPSGGTQKRNFPCRQADCTAVSSSGKDRLRHESTHEASSAAKFHCICGATARRRDNHLRHVFKCTKSYRTGGAFMCSEGHAYPTKEEYVAHMQDQRTGCGRAKGRPPKAF